MTLAHSNPYTAHTVSITRVLFTAAQTSGSQMMHGPRRAAVSSGEQVPWAGLKNLQVMNIVAAQDSRTAAPRSTLTMSRRPWTSCVTQLLELQVLVSPCMFVST